MKLTITPLDIAKLQLIEPGWRIIKIVKVERQQNSAKTGMNTNITFEIDNGVLSNKLPDVREIVQYLPDSNMGRWIPILEAVYDRKYTSAEAENIDFEPESLLGLSIWGNITREDIMQDYKPTGRLKNGISAFQSLNNSPV